MRSFLKICWITLIAVYVLILIGGVVRSTGAGMGCPDWPKCFGNWVPPTTVDELPENYKEVYASYRDKKNKKFANYLAVLGFKKTAEQILNDDSIKQEADFNATKTWIEYFNRIVGVIIGMLIVAVFIFSLKFWKMNRSITLLAFLSLVLVVFQGWIGSIVVSTNLTPWTITLHMLLAMLLVFLIVWLIAISSYEETYEAPTLTRGILISCLILLLVQIVLGTQVREAIDQLAMYSRDTWMERLGFEFFLHRSFSWIVLISHAYLLWRLVKTQLPRRILAVLVVFVAGTIITGTLMAYTGVPPVLQPVHLVLATATFGLQVLLYFKLSRRKIPLAEDRNVC